MNFCLIGGRLISGAIYTFAHGGHAVFGGILTLILIAAGCIVIPLVLWLLISVPISFFVNPLYGFLVGGTTTAIGCVSLGAVLFYIPGPDVYVVAVPLGLVVVGMGSLLGAWYSHLRVKGLA